MVRNLRVCRNFTQCNRRLIGGNDMLLAKWSSKKFLRNVFQVYNIIRHHIYSSTSPFLMLKIVAQNFHLQWQKCKHAKKRSFYVNVNSNQIAQNEISQDHNSCVPITKSPDQNQNNHQNNFRKTDENISESTLPLYSFVPQQSP